MARGARSGGGSYKELTRTGGVPIRAWTGGVHFEDAAQRQIANVARLPFVPDTLRELRSQIERAVPHGGGEGHRRGGWSEVPRRVSRAWRGLSERYQHITERHASAGAPAHAALLGGGRGPDGPTGGAAGAR